MTKYRTKHLYNQSNQISVIHQQVKVNHPKKPHQQSAQKKKLTKINAGMDQLDYSGGN